MTHCLSVVIPCFNEAATLTTCVDRVRVIATEKIRLEIIIVDDGSTDQSLSLAQSLAREYPDTIQVLSHPRNQGKGAALQTGFRAATGDFVAIQDADLEYNPQELIHLLAPLMDDQADVVLGSRFASTHPRRVLYFWHSMGNRFLTLVSNMFTDLNLTDMETCYKVFRREILDRISLEEKRFGVEPEMVAKMARLRLRIYEMGISYHGRTYAQGKKIGVKDGFRALYCILRYNAHQAPLPVQFFLYLFIGGSAALVNLACFLSMYSLGLAPAPAALIAFGLAAGVNYLLCIFLLFRKNARWSTPMEWFTFLVVVGVVALVDMGVTTGLIQTGLAPWLAKAAASLTGLFLNFAGRRFLVFPEPGPEPWI